MELDSLVCANCGATLTPGGRATIKCTYCGVTHKARESGELLLGADFSSPAGLAGWQVFQEPKWTTVAGDPPELLVNIPGGPKELRILQSAGDFDEVDVSVAVRFPARLNDSYALLGVREGVGTGYMVLLSSTRRITVILNRPGVAQDVNLYPWTAHPALMEGPRVLLRVTATSDRLRVYGNGVLITTTNAAEYPLGKVRLGIASPRGPFSAAFSGLEVRTPTAQSLAQVVAPPSAPASAAPEPSSWSVLLENCGSKKIQVIKEVMAACKLGLADAKNAVDAAPTKLRDGCTRAQADELVAVLLRSGAKARAVPHDAQPMPTAPVRSVLLVSTGPHLIMVIKVIREYTGLGLAEAKRLAESAPKVVKSGLDSARAEDLRKKLVAAGASVELR